MLHNPTPRQIRKPPSWLKDYDTNSERQADKELHNLAIFNSSDDPTTCEEAAKHNVWRKAMDLEIEAIVKNVTWELTTLPTGA